MIRHTVVFTLKHPAGSYEERAFLNRARQLAGLPTVRKFECLRQVSDKNQYHFGLSMEFNTKQDYEAYNNHPDHLQFVNEIWLEEVSDFMEIDYQSIWQSK